MKHTLRDGSRTREVEVRGTELVVDGESHELRIESLGDGIVRLVTPQGPRVAHVTRADRFVFVTLDGRDYVFESQPATARKTRRIEHPEGEISMPMPGRVVRVYVTEGEAVKRGQPLVVVEAMKMEHTLKAPRDGSVRHLSAKDGVLVEAGAMLMEIA